MKTTALKLTTLVAAGTLVAGNAFGSENIGSTDVTATKPVGAAATPASPTAKTDADTAALRDELESLRQKLVAIEKSQDQTNAALAEKTKDAGTFTFDENGFKATSADRNFQLRIRGLIQTDARLYFDEKGPGNTAYDSFILRRVRPIIEATLAKDYDAVFVPEFGGSYGIGAASSSVPAPTILDAYLNARIVGNAVQLRVGKFKSPIGLDLLQEDANRPLIESSFPTYLVPNRDIGAEVHGNIQNGLVSYQLGVFNGTADGAVNTNAPDFSGNKDVVGRIFVKPFASSSNEWINNLGLGVAADFDDKDGKGAANTTGTAASATSFLTTGYKTDGNQTFFTYDNSAHAQGNVSHIDPQFSWYVGSFSLLGEYVFSEQQVAGGNVANRVIDVNNRAWQITAGYVLTGEQASFTGITPKNSVLNGGLGAWEIVGRVSQLYIDGDVFSQGLAQNGGATPAGSSNVASATGAKSYALGVNWYLTKNLRLSADYTHTDFDSARTTSSILNSGENAILLRAQVAF